jgi:hypothetical protein
MHESNLFTKAFSPRLLQEITAIGLQALRAGGIAEFKDAAIAAALRRELLDGLYLCRNAGHYRASLWFAWQTIGMFGVQRDLAVQLCKWPLAVARNTFRMGLPARSPGVRA